MSRALVALASAAALAAPAFAVGYGFDAEYAGGPIPTIGTLTVSVNPDIVRDPSEAAIRTTHGAQFIAPKDAEDLVDELRSELEGELSRTGRYAPMVAGPVGTLVVTIEEASPSNPAHTRMGIARNLDFRSSGRGGATLSAELLGPDGAKVADFTYRWEESTFEVAQTARIGWWGAERAFDRFASRLSRELETVTPESAGS